MAEVNAPTGNAPKIWQIPCMALGCCADLVEGCCRCGGNVCEDSCKCRDASDIASYSSYGYYDTYSYPRRSYISNAYYYYPSYRIAYKAMPTNVTLKEEAIRRGIIPAPRPPPYRRRRGCCFSPYRRTYYDNYSDYNYDYYDASSTPRAYSAPTAPKSYVPYDYSNRNDTNQLYTSPPVHVSTTYEYMNPQYISSCPPPTKRDAFSQTKRKKKEKRSSEEEEEEEEISLSEQDKGKKKEKEEEKKEDSCSYTASTYVTDTTKLHSTTGGDPTYSDIYNAKVNNDNTSSVYTNTNYYDTYTPSQYDTAYSSNMPPSYQSAQQYTPVYVQRSDGGRYNSSGYTNEWRAGYFPPNDSAQMHKINYGGFEYLQGGTLNLSETGAFLLGIK